VFGDVGDSFGVIPFEDIVIPRYTA
jgi:hypothetical protein